MNKNQLKAFHAVAGCSSYSKAAEVLHLSQPTLSDHVRRLEERYGIKLFKRQGRGVALTSLGHALQDVTRRYFNLEQEAEQLLASSSGSISGSLRLVVDSPFLLTPVLANFCRHYPRIHLSINIGNSEQVAQALLDLEADIGILSNLEEDTRFTKLAFHQDRLVAFIDRDHPWSRRRSVKLEELGGQPLIMREKGSKTRKIFEQEMALKDLPLNYNLEISSREGIREAVACGLGIGVVLESEFGHDRRLHALRIRNASLKVTEFITCLKEARSTPTVAAFFELFEGQLG
ncbi:LysR substrate-binding domain-containing protein [Porticoccus sp. GXU_MW_L64]